MSEERTSDQPRQDDRRALVLFERLSDGAGFVSDRDLIDSIVGQSEASKELPLPVAPSQDAEMPWPRQVPSRFAPTAGRALRYPENGLLGSAPDRYRQVGL
jgi:hypothetical protein